MIFTAKAAENAEKALDFLCELWLSVANRES